MFLLNCLWAVCLQVPIMGYDIYLPFVLFIGCVERFMTFLYSRTIHVFHNNSNKIWYYCCYHIYKYLVELSNHVFKAYNKYVTMRKRYVTQCWKPAWISQNSGLSLRFYSNLRKLKKMHFSKKNLTQLEKKLKSPPHQT